MICIAVLIPCVHYKLFTKHQLKSFTHFTLLSFPDPDCSVDIASLGEGLIRKLPKYAQPLFIRLASQLDHTGTHKLVKRNFQREGFDLGAMPEGDRVYFKGPKDKR